VPTTTSRGRDRYSVMELVRPLLLPRRVNDSLYPFQRRGVAWLLRNERAILGDDMGLGKTAQALGAARRLVRTGRVESVLVVAPRTLVANWVAEAEQWAPELGVATVLATGIGRQEKWRQVVDRAHVLVTNYEQLREPPEAIRRDPPGVIIADEAHRLRRAESLATRGLRQVASKRLWCLTGTPLERDPEDIAVMLSLLEPQRFAAQDRALHEISVRARLRRYMLRRKKESVLDELPKVTENVEKLSLSEGQRLAYQRAIAEYAGKGNSGSYLVLFNRLRMICDLDTESGESSKLDRAVEIIEDISESGEKIVVFSYTLEPIRRLQQRIRRREVAGVATITGEMSLDARERELETFKQEPSCAVLLASTRVASEGLTLTEANHVLFVNRWWNPTANAQARDRVVRIGQSRNVDVISLSCVDTIEERLDELLTKKEATFDAIVESLAAPDARAFQQLVGTYQR